MQRSPSLIFTLITSILNFLYGLTFSAVSLISMLTLEKPDNSGASAGDQIGANLGYGLSTAILLIFAIIAGVYSAIALVHMLTKIIQTKNGGGVGASIFCMLFDALFTLANGMLSIALFTADGDPIAYVIAAVAGVLAILSVLSFIFNIKIIKE